MVINHANGKADVWAVGTFEVSCHYAASERNFLNYIILNNLETAEIAWLVDGKSVLLAHIFSVYGRLCNPFIQTFPPLHK